MNPRKQIFSTIVTKEMIINLQLRLNRKLNQLCWEVVCQLMTPKLKKLTLQIQLQIRHLVQKQAPSLPFLMMMMENMFHQSKHLQMQVQLEMQLVVL